MCEKTMGTSLKLGTAAMFSGYLAWVLSTPLLKLQKDNTCRRFTMPVPRHGQPTIGQDIKKRKAYAATEDSDNGIDSHDA